MFEKDLISEAFKERLIAKIAASKKYRALYPKTIERVVKNVLIKHSADEDEAGKKARNLLHQIWGIFYPTRPDFPKLLETFKSEIKAGKNIKEAILSILKLHASTKERIPLLNDFYEKIFQITGKPKTILDLASGLNPLTYFWLPEGIKCHAYDIDREQAEFLTSIFNFLEIDNVKIGLGDVFIDQFPKADIVFLFKILPLIRQQQKTKSLPEIHSLVFYWQ